MRHYWIIALFLLVAPQLVSQTLTAQQRGDNWIEVSCGEVGFPCELWRQLPFENDYRLIASLEENRYRDTIECAICGDTIRYRLVYGSSSSIETKVWFQDVLPPAETAIRIVTTDSANSRVDVEWLESQSPDVAAYIICKGSPCVDPDTVYTNRYSVDYEGEEVSFRVFVIDSCGNPSALSLPCNNVILSVAADSCGGTVTARWNEYRNMLGGLGSYVLQYADNQTWRDLDSTQGLSIQCRLPEQSEDSCRFRVKITDSTYSQEAYSNMARVAVVDTVGEACPTEDPRGGESEDGSFFALPNVLLYNQPPNDCFQPCCGGVLPEGVSDYKLSIYCRTGRRVFYSEDPSEAFTGWNGKHVLQGGAYVYLLYYSKSGEQHSIKGQLLLIK